MEALISNGIVRIGCQRVRDVPTVYLADPNYHACFLYALCVNPPMNPPASPPVIALTWPVQYDIVPIVPSQLQRSL